MVLGTLDDAFENELLRPSQFLEERPEKRRFSKWPTSVRLKLEIFICGAISTNKKKDLTNFGMGNPFLI